MTERVEEIRRRHEEFVARYSPGPDWEPCNQMSLDRGWLLTALAQAERIIQLKEEQIAHVMEDVAQAERERARMEKLLHEHTCDGTAARAEVAALTEERNRLRTPENFDMALALDEIRELRAEVERLLIENDAARKSIGEAWDTAVADGRKIRLLEAEVERLKGHGQLTKPGNMWYDRAMQAEADRARVRAALEKHGQHDPHCHVEIDKLLTYDASRPAAGCTCGLSAALEGRG